MRKRVESRVPPMLRRAARRSGGVRRLVILLSGLHAAVRLCRLRLPTDSAFVAFAPSANNRRALARLQSLLPGLRILVDQRRGPVAALPSMLAAMAILTAIFSKRRIPGASAADLVLQMLLCQFLAAYVVFSRRLPARTAAAVVANDHAPLPCGFLAAAQHHGLKLVYVQHGEISHLFPPLKFDLALLYGERSKGIYAERGDVASVALMGTGTSTLPVSVPDTTDAVGIALTNLDAWTSLPQDIARIKHALGAKRVVVRPHPAFRGRLPGEDHGDFEVSRGARLDEDARAVDLFVCGNSSVVLDLLRQGVPVAYYSRLDPLSWDYYGFVRDNVVPELDPDEGVAALARIKRHYQGGWRAGAASYDVSFTKSDDIIAHELQERFEALLEY